MDKEKINKGVVIIGAALLAVFMVIAIAGWSTDIELNKALKESNIKISQFSCPPALEDKAILDTYTLGTSLNEDDDSEMFSEFIITNYGNSEARNVVVKCKVSENINGVVLKGYSKNIGNVASRSSAYQTVVSTAINVPLGELLYTRCYVESCENCDILWKRVPEIVELYEG